MNHRRLFVLRILGSVSMLACHTDDAPRQYENMVAESLPALTDSVLASPLDVVAYKEDLYIGDEESPHIKVLNRSGELIRSFGLAGRGPSEVAQATSVAVSGDSVVVADMRNSRVSFFTASGQFARSIAVSGSFGAMIVDKTGNLHLDRGAMSRTNDEIQRSTVDVLSPTGALLRSYGKFLKPTDEKGTGLHNRSRLATDQSGGTWVLYTYRGEALYFDSNGNHMRTLTVPTSKDWNVDAPYSQASPDGMSFIVIRPTVADDIAVDDFGRVFVLVTLGYGDGRDMRSVLHVYSPEGNLEYSASLAARYRAIEVQRKRLLLLRHMRLNDAGGIDTVPAPFS